MTPHAMPLSVPAARDRYASSVLHRLTMNTIPSRSTLVARAVALACWCGGLAPAHGATLQAVQAPGTERTTPTEQPGTCARDARGRMADQCLPDPRAIEIDRRDHLPGSSERELPRLTFLLGDDRAVTPSSSERDVSTPGATVARQDSRQSRFDSGMDLLKPEDRARLDEIVAQVKGRPGLRFDITGHTDAQRIGAALRQRFPDNQALGLARAQQVARYLAEQLGLPASAFATHSRGPDQPVAGDPQDRARWPANRRVEVQVFWQDPAPTARRVATTTLVDPTECDMLSPQLEDDSPVRLTIDGRSGTAVAATSADRQRCTDVRLEQHQLRLQYDSLSQPRRLNAAAWPTTVTAGDTVRFAGYSNYRLFIARAELRVFTANEARQPVLLAQVPLDAQLAGQWTVPDALTTGVRPQDKPRLYYRLRVYDAEGRFDETDDFTLSLVDQRPPASADLTTARQQADHQLLAAYSESRLAIGNIPVRGGTVTASGQAIAPGQRVRALGVEVPVDSDGRFVMQQIVPARLHTAEIAVIDPDGRARVYRRDLEIPAQDSFFVGQADLTLGHQNTSGPAALLTDDKNRYQGDHWAEGRIAFYGKRRLDQRWTLTGSLDTEERPLNELLRNLDRKDPTSLFRRVDPVDSWATFGDDSTSIDDAPTQGRVYLRLDDGRSHLLWGDFKLYLGDTTLAQVSRGLYGLQGRYLGDDSTSFGDARLRLDVFAAQPGTLSGREEFRATGGSLYYLRHQDVTRGAEKVLVEVRDRDSGLVLSRRQLVPAADYEIDYLQGRVLLSAPLSSLSDDGGIVRAGGLTGHPVYLVVDYEYAPLNDGGFDSLASGGRLAWWATDAVRFGVTASHQNQTGGDQRLAGLDLTVRRSETTYLKAEVARTDGPGTGQYTSLDGGFNFGLGAAIGPNDSASAWRVESQLDLREIAPDQTGRVAAYAQYRDAGFSGPGQLTTRETRQAGVSAMAALGEKTELRLKADHRDETQGFDTDSAEAQLAFQLTPNWSLAAGLRLDDKTGDALLGSPLLLSDSTVEGQRTDLSLQLDYDSQAQWSAYAFVQDTLRRTGTRRDNDRLGLGARLRLTDKLSLNGELSGGDGGAAGKAGVDYQYDDRSSVYMTYVLDTGRTDENNLGRGGALVTGVKSRLGDGLSVYTEHRHSTGAQAGLTHAYGVQYAPDTRWTLGASLENGRVESETIGELDREALAFTAGFATDEIRYSGGAEYRLDRSRTEQRRSWLLKNALSIKDGQDARWLGKLNWADSDSDAGSWSATRYTEAMLGYAWRPVRNDRLNLLFKYTFLHDLSSPGQVVTTEVTPLAVATTGIDYQQRSQVLAIDATYDLTPRWTVGGKLAWRVGELRASRDDSAPWFKSSAELAIVRLDWKVVRQWDWLLELRTLNARELGDRKSGFLTAGYYHVNENFKVGLGHNFTDFSDNLTDLSYRSRGWFLNLLGTF